MRRTHRLPQRLIRWTGLLVSLSILGTSTVTPIGASSAKSPIRVAQGQRPFVSQGQRQPAPRDKGKRVTARPLEPGRPPTLLPNLDEARQRKQDKPKAQRAIESTSRSLRKPLESRHGRKVGDPLPLKQKASTDSSATDSERVVSDDARGYGMAVRRGHTLTARSLSVAHESSFAPANLIRVASLRGLANHAAFDFLRYPNLQSEAYRAAISELHGAPRSAGATSRFGDSLVTESAELFFPAMPQTGSSKIVFATNRDGSMQIYVMNGDGSGVTRLTNSGANDDYPRWSPNGTKILFQSDRDHPDTGYMDIYVMNSDGTGVTRLTTDENDDSMASWSPDGSQIVFQSMRNGVNYQVYSMSADGSNQINLTNTSSSDGEPSWSPDGTKIVFASDRDHVGYDSVYVMSSNGNQQRLTFSADTVDDTQPAWSPDGSKLAFVSTRDSTTETWQETDDDGNVISKSRLHINKEVYVMNADGSAQLRLTNDLANDDSPSWSPDGSMIVFRSDRERDCCDPSAQVWTMNTDGASQMDLSNSGNGDYSASWTNGNSFAGSVALDSHSTSGNQPPVAIAGGPYVAQSGQPVQLNGAGSFDRDGTIVNYSWDFGDGTAGTGSIVNHQYYASGVYSVSLSVSDNNGNSSSSQGFVSVDAVSVPVKIDFNELPNNYFGLGDQYLKKYGVKFYSSSLFNQVHTWQNCGPCSTTSPPNFISTLPDASGVMNVEFTQPVSNLTFYMIGVDAFFNQFATLDVYRNGNNTTPAGTFPIFGNGTYTVGITLGTLDNISKIVIRGITDVNGVGFDDFSFNVPVDVKITSAIGNTLAANTQYSELVWADVVLKATPLLDVYDGGTYHWTFTGPSSISGGSPNAASVTMRSTEVGIIAATLTYSKSGISVSKSFTINSTLPRLTHVTTHQNTDQISAPHACGNTFDEINWRFRLGCPLTLSQVGISFEANVETDGFISDGSQSAIKFVQAVSTFHKQMAQGMQCFTRRTVESNVASGWQLDTENPYGNDSWDFSNLSSFHVETNDSPSHPLTRFSDWDFNDAAYVDDRFEMYIVYFTGSAGNPTRQRALGRYRWNWGGLAVLDWNGTDGVHTVHSSNPGVPVFDFTDSMVTMNGNVLDTNSMPVQCPGGPPLTSNRIDSSREFVKYHYIDFLGRDPSKDNFDAFPPILADPVGWNFWTSNISQCIFDLNCVHNKRIATGLAFFLSGEFILSDPIMANGPGTPNFDQAAYNHEFVYWCYWKYLHKPPDPDGWDFWTRSLNEGVDQNNYSHIIDAFQSSSDYRDNRVFQ